MMSRAQDRRLWLKIARLVHKTVYAPQELTDTQRSSRPLSLPLRDENRLLSEFTGYFSPPEIVCGNWWGSSKRDAEARIYTALLMAEIAKTEPAVGQTDLPNSGRV